MVEAEPNDQIQGVFVFRERRIDCQLIQISVSGLLQKDNMQYRNLELSKRPSNRINEPAVVPRKGWETDVQVDKFAFYDPFNSPNILRCWNTPPEDKLACQKALFEDEEADDLPEPLSENTTENIAQPSILADRTFSKIINDKKVLVDRARRDQKEGKPQLMEEQFSFNKRRRLRYPQTPNFKQILQSPLPKFLCAYTSKIQDLKSQVKRKISISGIEHTANPASYMSYGYKYFICVAEQFKKNLAATESRAMYKIALYLQPYDEAVWEWVVKFEEELGFLEKAYTLCKTGFLFTSSETLALKYLRLAERCERPIEEVRGIVSCLAGKVDKNTKIYFQLAKLEWKIGDKKAAFKVLYWLSRCAENNLNYVLDLAKFLESIGCMQHALEALYNSIQKNVKIYNVYSLYLKFIEADFPELICENIDYVISKADENLPIEVRWKLHMEVSQIYARFGLCAFVKRHLKLALELSPNNSKWKPYLTICKVMRIQPAVLRNSLYMVEVNKNRFLAGTTPIIFPYAEWKHYLHYSLFYVLQANHDAWKVLEEAANRWSYAGRLWAQVLWVLRIKAMQSPKSAKDDILQRWTKIVTEVPKSGEVWCQGGRIFCDMGDYKKAKFCFEAAMHLTPQYGDSFIEALRLYMIMGRRKAIKKLRQRILYSEPFYGNVWCYLKSHPRSTVMYLLMIFSDIWKRAKRELRQQLYTDNVDNYEITPKHKHLTAVESYNRLFREGVHLSQNDREKIISAYDQLENSKC